MVVCVVVCTKMNVFTSLNISLSLSLLLNVDRVSTGFEQSIFLTENAVKV